MGRSPCFGPCLTLHRHGWCGSSCLSNTRLGLELELGLGLGVGLGLGLGLGLGFGLGLGLGLKLGLGLVWLLVSL